MWHVMIFLRKRSERQGLLTESFARGRGLGSGSRFLMFRGHVVGVVMDAITSMLFQVGKFEHEGLKRRIYGFSGGLFGGGFKAVL